MVAHRGGFTTSARSDGRYMKQLFFLLLATLTPGLTQLRGADFQNLDFESPTFIPVGSSFQGSMDPSAALPGWTAYWGSSLAPYVLYGNYFLDSSGISILDGNPYSKGAPLQGQYSLLLQGGIPLAPAPPNDGSASIAQTGLIPSWAKSLTFQMALPGESFPQYFEVSVAGQTLQNFGGKVDISPFSGQEVEIRFTADHRPFSTGGLINNIIIDDIAFSVSVVPEPTTQALLAVVFLLFCFRFYRDRLTRPFWNSTRGDMHVQPRERRKYVSGVKGQV
jgi:hypothetical protein